MKSYSFSPQATLEDEKIAFSVRWTFTLLVITFFTVYFIFFSGDQSKIWSNSGPQIDYSFSCPPPISIQATIRSKDHSGSVSKPVGTNIQGLQRWSNVNSWQGNSKPTTNDNVLIPSNSVIVIDENTNVNSITVEGKLIVDLSKDINISAKFILVQGSGAYFEWGTENTPYTKNGVITLIGSDRNETIPGSSIHSKAIVVGNQAVIELHGNTKKSWTRLGSNASANQNKITVEDETVGWEVGDEILIVSSRLNWNEAEKKRITQVSGDGKTFTLNSNLSYPHIGQKKSYTRSKDGKTWEAEIRAEVGLLTKSIKIQGDNDSENLQHGGHFMIHSQGIAHVDGIELYQMGQKSILGRYPFHWHLLLDKGEGQYLKNSSIHRSYNRAITIHGTESTLVENNFAYDHIGHGLFLEDGSERFNIIRRNVMVLSKKPANGEELTPSDNQFNEVQNRTPSQFWITNPNNIFENNVAAGTQGTGFWFAMPQSPMQQSSNIPYFQGLEPHKEKLGKFSGNVSHSCKSGFDIFDQLNGNHSIRRNLGWLRTDNRYIDKHIFYANDLANYGGIGQGRQYTESVIFRDNVYSDNKTAVMFASYVTIENSVFIANSGENVFNGERKLNRGYDGSLTMKNCHLVGWNADNANYVQNTGGAQKHVNYRISGMTLSPDASVRMAFPNYSGIPNGNVGANSVFHPRFWSYVHWDIDGSLSGKANTSIITNHPLCRDGSEVRYANWQNLYRTDRRFGYALIDAPGNPKMTIVRTKEGTPKAGQYYINGFYGTFVHFPVMVNDNFLYTLQFESLGTGKNVVIRMRDVYTDGDEILFRIKEFGRLPGLSISNANKVSSLNQVQNANSTSYAIVGKDVYLKMIARTNPDFSSRITWSTNINLPILDTDGDGVSDKQESINGTDPIPNDPIPTNPVIDWEGSSENQLPVVNISEPTDFIIEEGYENLYILAEASDPDNDTIRTELYINGEFVRQESTAPYEWGHISSNTNFTEETRNLGVGEHEFRVVVIDSHGASAETSFTLTVVERTLSVSDFILKDIKIFPNPADQKIQLDISDKMVDAYFRIADLNGKILIQQKINANSTQLDISNLQNGIYIAIVQGKSYRQVIKLVKK